MAQYLQIAGTQVTVPDYCRLDLAYENQYMFGTLGAGSIATQQISGNYVEIVTGAFFTLTTDSQVSSRICFFDVRDGSNNTLVATYAGGTQAASLVVTYAMNIGLPYPTGTTPGLANFGLPVFACLPGVTFRFGASGRTSGDVMSAVTATVLRIPTGPVPETHTVMPVLTPVLV